MTCGIDEAGRGPLAGPVCAAAVVLGDGENGASWRGSLNDSKRLNEKSRDSLAKHIKRDALLWSIAWASPKEIDELNIHGATLLAMKRAYLQLGPGSEEIRTVLVDGKFVPDLVEPVEMEAIVGGDGLVEEIMAASILAKTARDAYMIAWEAAHPGYGFDRHKGYPTKEHRRRIAEKGPSPIHRLSFRPFSSP